MHPWLKHIQAQRLADDLWDLVTIPSPTSQERNAACAFAQRLREAGATVEMDETIHDSPNVIGRLKGKRPGKTLQLAGHLDHIPTPHPSPERHDDIISGRGAADMKGGLAGILEVVRVLNECHCDFPGEILATVYGLHEAPRGDSTGLLNLIKNGVVGHAAIVMETGGPENEAVIMGKGQSIWTITIRSDDISCHELRQPVTAHDLLNCALRVAALLQQDQRKLQTQTNAFPLLTPESLFVGQIHYGDFYNRIPNHCFLQGTRRWHPNRTFSDIQRDFSGRLSSIDHPAGITINCEWTFVGEAYQVQSDEPIIQALRRAFQTLAGKTMNYAGISAVVDASRLVPIGHIPTALCSFDGATAHADYEFVRISRLLSSCRLLLQTSVNYLTDTHEN